MMRKKTAMMLDSRYTTLIENAYYYCNPPETKAEKQKERNPVYEYVRKLLYKDLSRVTIEKVNLLLLFVLQNLNNCNCKLLNSFGMFFLSRLNSMVRVDVGIVIGLLWTSKGPIAMDFTCRF